MASRLDLSTNVTSNEPDLIRRQADDLRDAALDEDDATSADTIFALSSGSAVGQATAVAVIRLTGPRSAELLRQLTPNKALPKPRHACVRKLVHPTSGEALDQALVLYFPGPHSFTGEDVVELHCHGSRAVVQAVFQVLSDLGCRLAEPGEFTQRAWLSGKLDVLQIEALADLLTADTDKQRAQALQQLDGKLSAIYDAWREQLIRGLAHAEAVIDFGDDERLDDDVFEEGFTGSHQQQQENVWGGVMAKMKHLREQMQRQLFDQRRGELVREGVQIAIVGPPNAGKSSLFNLLADRDAAIVSPTAGTTRDVLELSLNLGGVKCILKDTAGVRAETQDGIELEGMRRAILAAGEADLVVAVVDSTEAEVGIDVLNSVLDNSTSLHAEHVVLVLNKVDLQGIENESSSTSTAIKEALGNVQHRLGATFEVSCITQEGIDLFLGDLTERVGSRVAGDAGDEDVEDANALLSDESALITRARHRQHVQAAVEALQRFDVLSQQGTMAVDMAAEELRLAASELGRITGAVDVEDVLDKLFSDFCIGK